jgi:pyruvate/2-oxoglutarate dehydrogenase complex dihydrolipoamide dehydrogenase (E3) component
MPDYDAIIIGTGQPGPALARRLVAAGRKVAIIERKLFGGTCVNTGCTPTKTLVASAYVAHAARRAADYGVMIEGAVNVDMKAVKARKDAVVAVFRNGIEQSLKTLEGCTVYEGHGRFIAEKKVVVNGYELAADQIFINVGARAAIPPTPGLDQVPYLTNSSMMDIDFLPSHLNPPLGRAGMTEAEVRRRGKSALISTLPMEDVMRAFERGETKGFMKILVDRDSKQILGASFLGLEGDEVIHCVLDIMYAKAPYTVIQRAMHIHPTVSEFIPTLMDQLKPLQ